MNKINWVKFESHHLYCMETEDATFLVDNNLTKLLEQSFAETGFVDGLPICCGGYHQFLTPNKYNCWAVVDKTASPYMLEITRYVKNKLAKTIVPRLECNVVEDFAQAFKFARLVGFELETPKPMKNWYIDLKGAYQFGLTKEI